MKNWDPLVSGPAFAMLTWCTSTHAPLCYIMPSVPQPLVKATFMQQKHGAAHPACSQVLQSEVLVCKSGSVDAVTCTEEYLVTVVTNLT